MINNTLTTLNKTLIPFHKKIQLFAYKAYKINNNIAQAMKATDQLTTISNIHNYFPKHNSQIQQTIEIASKHDYIINFKLLSRFYNYKILVNNNIPANNKTKNTPEINYYEKTCAIHDNIQNTKCLKSDNPEHESYYKLEYNHYRQLTIQGKFLLARPHFDSKQDNILIYLSNNPNKTISQEELENAIGEKITSPLRNIVKDLGFKGEIREAFIDVNKNSIKFKTEITKSDYKELSNSFIPIQCKTPKKNNIL